MTNKNQNTKVVVVNNAEIAEVTINTAGVEGLISDKFVRGEVKRYIKASDGIKKNLWTMYRAVAAMMVDDAHKVVFSTDGELARFLCVSNSTLSKMRRIGNMSVGMTSLEEMGYSTAQAEEMLPAMKYMTVEVLLLCTDISPESNRDDIRKMVKRAVRNLTQIIKLDKGNIVNAGMVKDAVADHEVENAKDLLILKDDKTDVDAGEDAEEDAGVDAGEDAEEDAGVDAGEKEDVYEYELPWFNSQTEGIEERIVSFISYDELERFTKLVRDFMTGNKRAYFLD